MSTKLFQRTNLNRRAPNYIGTFRNTKRAHKLVSGIAILFSDIGRLQKEGRNPNRKGLVAVSGRCHSDLRRGVPIPLATHFDVYLHVKDWNLRNVGYGKVATVATVIEDMTRYHKS